MGSNILWRLDHRACTTQWTSTPSILFKIRGGQSCTTGQFREDLYYRLAAVTIRIPPLRDRSEDLILLANTFLRRAAQEYRRKARFAPDAPGAILAYAWPGNVRELEKSLI